MIRRPAVAGQFYPSDPDALKKLIASFGVRKSGAGQKTIACLLPHAGYIYSGKVAALVLSQIEPADTFIILGPNHTGYGPASSIMREGAWQTPLGSVKIDTPVAEQILQNSKYLREDAAAHAYEHSVEVQLPLIKEIIGGDFAFVPIVLASDDVLVYKDIAAAVSTAVKKSRSGITLVASSDMTHYESQGNAAMKDQEAIQAMLALDEEGLLKKIGILGISMCGYLPAAVSILAAKQLGAKKARLVAYQTSGDVTGDYSSVVGYAGLVIQ